MRTHQIGFAIVLAGFGALSFATACDQPDPYCNIGHSAPNDPTGRFVARLTKLEGNAACDEDDHLIFGTQAYNAEGPKGQPDFEKISVAFVESRLGARYAENEAAEAKVTGKRYAQGVFTTPRPDSNGICRVNMTSEAAIDAEAIPAVPAEKPGDEPTPEVPAFKRSAKFEDTQVYVTASAAGTQMKTTVTVTTNGNACKYEAVALFPEVDCRKLNADGEPTKDGSGWVTFDALCNAEPDAYNPDESLRRVTGSGLNPDYRTYCDKKSGLCMLDYQGKSPVLK